MPYLPFAAFSSMILALFWLGSNRGFLDAGSAIVVVRQAIIQSGAKWHNPELMYNWTVHFPETRCVSQRTMETNSSAIK